MFDNAVFTFGTALSNELSGVEGKTKKDIEKKSDRIISKWLNDPTAKKKFKDPAKKAVL